MSGKESNVVHRGNGVANAALVIGVVNLLIITGATLFVFFVNHQMVNLVKKSSTKSSSTKK